MVSAAPTKKKQRLVYDAKKGDRCRASSFLRRAAEVTEVSVNPAYDYAGHTYDFYDQVFRRNSLDDNGMTLVSSVHVGGADETGESCR